MTRMTGIGYFKGKQRFWCRVDLKAYPPPVISPATFANDKKPIQQS